MKLTQREILARGFAVLIAVWLVVVCNISKVHAELNLDQVKQRAELGSTDDQFKLAEMYFKGEGVPKNYVYSYAWFKVAAAHGSDEARKKVDTVSSLLNLQQLLEAEKLYDELEHEIADNRSRPSSEQPLAKEKKKETGGMKKKEAQKEAEAKLQSAKTHHEGPVRWTPFQLAILDPIQLFPDTWNVYGLRTSVVYGKNQDVYGLDFGALTSRANNLTGIQFGGFVNRVSERAIGIQIAGIGNNALNADMIGMQIGLSNLAGNLTGIQMGAFAVASESSTGIQFGGIATKTGELKGVQTGFVNIEEKGFGVQFGGINVATKMSGLQIGVINIIKDGFLPFFPGINFSMTNKVQSPPEDIPE